MQLEELRKRIDKIDRELLVLLQERMGLALCTRKFKKSVSDPQREEIVLKRAENMKLDLIKPDFTRRLLKSIISESRRLQEEERLLVAFQGEHGAYGEVAARRLVPDGGFIPCMEFADVFKGVAEGYFDLGVVPVENSLEGAVTQVNHLLTSTDLKVTGEVKVHVNHCLLATDVRDISEVRVVYSHPQALAQCRDFLSSHNMEAVPFYDTAGAAKMLARENPRASAAIASRLCAALYNLNILAESIEDGPVNTTRFLMLSKEAYPGKGDKTSVIFSTPHRAGSLFEILGLFAEEKINLTRISSMPIRTEPGNYSFFLDFEGDLKDRRVGRVISEMKKRTPSFKILGSYPADTKDV